MNLNYEFQYLTQVSHLKTESMKTFREAAMLTMRENGLTAPPSWLHPPIANSVFNSGFFFFRSLNRTYILSSFHSYIAIMFCASILAKEYMMCVHRNGSMSSGKNLAPSGRYWAQFV